MILSRLDLTAFGKFTDVSIDLSAGPRRFHLVFGPNEAGKSTTLRAITSLLFGMSTRAEDCYVHKKERVRVGGLLVNPTTGDQLECVRRRGRKATLRDASDDQIIDETVIQGMLEGIDEGAFLSQFGLSYESLVDGGAAIVDGKNDLGQILFAAGAGVGQLRDIQASLDANAKNLFASRSSKPAINVRLKALEEGRKELKEVQIPTSSFMALQKQLASQKREAEELNEELFASARSHARLKAFREAVAILPEWRESKESLSRLPETPQLDDAFTERRRKKMTDREIAVSRQQEIENRIADLTGQLDALGQDDAVLHREKEIEVLFQQIAAREQAGIDRASHQREQQDLENRITTALAAITSVSSKDAKLDSKEAVDRAIEKLHVNDSDRTKIRRLAQRNAALVQRRESASDALETTRRRLADVTQELESIGDVGDTEALGNVIDSIGKPESVLDSLLQARQKCESQRRRCDAMLRQLEGYEGDLENVVKLPLPSEISVRELSERLRSTLQDVEQAEATMRGRQIERDELHHALVDEQADLKLPTTEELLAIRRERDDAADLLSGTLQSGAVPPTGSLNDLQQWIRKADQVVDTIREHHEQVHRRETLVARIASADEKIQAAQRSLEDSHARCEVARSTWTDAWRSCEIIPGTPVEMQQWRSRHEQLCSLMDQLEEDERNREQIQNRIFVAVRRLRASLESVRSGKPVAAASVSQAGLFDEPCEDDLAQLYDDAAHVRAQWLRDRQQYDEMVRRRDEFSKQLAELEVQFEKAQQDVGDWTQQWRRVTESFVDADRADTAEVSDLLDKLNELSALKRSRESVDEKLRAFEQDEEAYEAKVRTLAQEIGDGPEDSRAVAAIANGLYRRLELERSAQQSRRTLKEQIASAQRELAQAGSQKAECDVWLKQLCEEVGCAKPEELPEIEQRSRKCQRLQSTVRQLSSDLARLADDLDLDEFATLAGEQDSATLALDIEREESRLSELNERNTELQQQIGGTQNELNRIDGGSRASDLVQEIQVSAGALRSDVEDYARLKIGSLILKRAIEHYRAENQSPVLQLANGYFDRLTCGEYRELKPDFDASGSAALYGINRDGEFVPVSAMSKGTADALFLALRLASLEHQFRDGRTVPVVIDDCLIQLDDDRAAAALQAFSDLSEKTQVILFTHHQHLCELAEQKLSKDAFHLHEIGA